MHKLSVSAVTLLIFGVVGSASATTKGLNQIVTPDVQPFGQVSVSFQAEHEVIGNSLQVQVEVGVARNFEVAVFQGYKPGEFFGAVEVGLVKKGPWLLSGGFGNWSTRGDKPQGYIEGGWYKGKQKWMLGVADVNKDAELILGFGYQSDPKTLLQVDYQSGRANFSTYGLIYNITPTLSLNPAIYIANGAGHHAFPYAVLTWNIAGWK